MAPSNFNFLKAEVLSRGNLFLRSFLQPVACPLSEQLACDKQQRWPLAPCSGWLRHTLHRGLFKRERLGTVPACCYETDAVWPVRTCCVSRPSARKAPALLSCWFVFLKRCGSSVCSDSFSCHVRPCLTGICTGE